MSERRRSDMKFLYLLSLMLVMFSFGGAAWVLMDPLITIGPFNWGTITIGRTPFSADLRGSVVSTILVGGFAGVVGYWLGASNAGNKPTAPSTAITAETIEHQDVKP